MIAILLIALVAAATARCPAVKTQPSFNATAYLGQWYEIARSPLVGETFERNCFCTRAKYGLNATTGDVTVDNTCRIGSVGGKLQEIIGYAKIDPSDHAKLTVYFPGRAPFGAPYWVVYVGGAYEVAVVWSCESLVIPFEFVWILARTPQISSATYQATAAKLKEITGYNPTKLHLTAQTGCK